MKTIKFIAPVIAAFILFSCKPSPEKARKFNDMIIDEQIKIQDKENALIDALGASDVLENISGSASAYDAYMSQVRISTEIVSKLDKFDKNDDFKNATLTFFDVYKSIGDNEYKQIIEIYKKGQDYNDEDEQKVNGLITSKNDKRQGAFEKFSAFQQTFANKYGFKIGS